MRDLLITINEKYQRNRAIIWFIVVVVVLFLLVTRGMDKYAKKVGGSGNNTTTSGSVYEGAETTASVVSNVVAQSNDNYNEINEKLKDIRFTRQDRINLFVQLCNNKKFDTAYEYISEDCKQVLYPTKEDFMNSYGNVIFKTSKMCQITSFKNNTYKVKYINDPISTGVQTSNDGGIIDYITITDDGKINISNLISRKQLNITSIAPYFTVYVKEKCVFTDYELYTIEVRNNTNADIYMNDVDNSNLYIRNAENNIYTVDSSYMFDNIYYVAAGDKKEIKLRFNLNYSDNNRISQLCFGNIKVVNKEYYDTISEKMKKTKFQEKTSWTINF